MGSPLFSRDVLPLLLWGTYFPEWRVFAEGVPPFASHSPTAAQAERKHSGASRERIGQNCCVSRPLVVGGPDAPDGHPASRYPFRRAGMAPLVSTGLRRQCRCRDVCADPSHLVELRNPGCGSSRGKVQSLPLGGSVLVDLVAAGLAGAASIISRASGRG